MVQVPLESLDLSSYIINSDSRANTLRKPDARKLNGFSKEVYPLYDLVGVVNHFGDRTNSGHYTATVRNLIDNRWRTFDDMKVTFTEPHEISLSSNAYLLFYERRSNNNGFLAPWYPNSIPDSVIKMYTAINSSKKCDDYTNGFNGGTKTKGGSNFYVNTDTNTDNIPKHLTTNAQQRQPQFVQQESPTRSKSYQALSKGSPNKSRNSSTKYYDRFDY